MRARDHNLARIVYQRDQRDLRKIIKRSRRYLKRRLKLWMKK